ncbi:MAG: CDP-alcohol phosphatidyltransferase family protein [Candidatus Thermoplasmatota archaeon]|jgi:archaetidylinositol phosphate synthase|nr:CDP-alcohol phosphatidyltransferase family protein [Candidatus Thermoplasmatota archaeon]
MADTKRRGENFAEAVSGPFMRFSPNSISVSSLILALAAGLFFYIGNYYLVIAVLFVALSALFDAVDGQVARAKNLASKRGDYIDHVIDRYSDIAIITGIGLSHPGNAVILAFALSGVLLTSYLGTQAQAIGLGRDYEGIMGRANRLIIIILFSIVQIILPFSYSLYGFPVTPFILLLLVLAVGGHLTALRRISRTFRRLNQ